LDYADCRNGNLHSYYGRYLETLVMEEYTRKTRMTVLKNYDHLAKEHDFIEICEWHNGEGFDVTISDNKSISLTWGEFEALTALAHYKG